MRDPDGEDDGGEALRARLIDEHARRFSDFLLRIWNYAEPAWPEYKSAKAYCDLLRRKLYGRGGLGRDADAFCALGRSGPVLGSYAEYDAVPGNSQQVVPIARRAAGCIPGAGTRPAFASARPPRRGFGSEAAMEKFASPARSFLRRTRREGLRLEAGARREGLLRQGDAFISYHPHFANTASGHAVRLPIGVLSSLSRPPHRRVDRQEPDPDDAHLACRAPLPGAIDALCLMYTTTKYTKEAMFPHIGT